jgi:hypothetical protein
LNSLDSPGSVDATEPPTDATDERGFPAAKFFGAIALLVISGMLMLFGMLLAFSESGPWRTAEPSWWWAGIGCQLFAGWLFLGVASDASEIPAKQRSPFVLPGIVVANTLAAAIVVFDAWAVATILELF